MTLETESWQYTHDICHRQAITNIIPIQITIL